MIIVEDRLKYAFNELPNVGITEENPLGFKPFYDWGNQFHLNKVYITTPKSKLYPLIYQTSNNSTQLSKGKEVRTRLSLVLATRNVFTDKLNKQRWEGETYRNVLFPLVKNIETLFTKGQMFLWDGEYDITTVPNYGADSQPKDPKATPMDIWDAVLFETTIKINNDCLKPIIF